MNENELKNILEKHKKWLAGNPDGERADLCYADLRMADLDGADLCGANLRNTYLRGANLRGANLYGADLCGANLDYSAWPLWCGSFDVKVDKRIAAQLAYHFCRLDCDDPDYLEARKALIPLANQFHRAEECGEVTPHD